jgi:hypothetical protein
MSPASEMLKTTEAAVVSRVALRDVNRAIDDAEKVELATIFAEAYPPRGRPRSGGELPKGAVIIADRRVPRRKKAK